MKYNMEKVNLLSKTDISKTACINPSLEEMPVVEEYFDFNDIIVSCQPVFLLIILFWVWLSL